LEEMERRNDSLGIYMNLTKPKTLQQAIRYFSDEQVCIDTVAALRWPNGVECPACEHKEHYYLKTQKRWKCKECGRQFSVKLGTIFEDSALSLDKWLCAMWLIANCKNGVSSYEVARDLGITQKSAWFMMHRIRLALQSGTVGKLGGGGKGVEADEAFIGPHARNVHFHKRDKKVGQANMAMVVGILERGGKVRAQVVHDRKRTKIHQIVHENVHAGSPLYTDKLLSYKGLETTFEHQVIDHAEGYVRGQVHTNGLENFWSLLKRGLGGTYVSVEPFHLFRYLDEQVFRYNNRKDAGDKPLKDYDRFNLVLSNVAGKRLTYAGLTGKAPETTV
jgi:transposase-like protein